MKTDIICLFVKGKPAKEVYLGVKKRGFGEGKHVAVGGGVEPGETLPQAAVREVKEETGIELTAADLTKMGKIKFTFPAKPEWNRIVHIYLVRQWQGEPQESDEIKPYWFKAEDIPYEKMWADGKHWLPRVLAGEKIDAKFTFEDDNETLKEWEIKTAKDFLFEHLKALPYFRSLLRSVEASFYQDYELPGPIYDVGCGDGHFASLAFDFKIDVGLDPWEKPIKEAPIFGAYTGLVVADGAMAPFPANYFASGLSNSVLEHIEHIDEVLKDTARVLQPGAPFLFCVPNEGYYTALSIPAILRNLGLKGLAQKYTDWFGRMSVVFHADMPEVWRARLEKAGFTLEQWWHYFSPTSMRVLEWGHYFGLPSLVAKKLIGRWILSPTKWNLALTNAFARRYAGTEHRPDGTFTFFIARKR